MKMAGAIAERTEVSDGPMLLRRCSGGVLTLTLNRPLARNSLSRQLIDELQTALDQAADDPDSRVIVVAANGTVFCAGHDIRELSAARQAKDGGKAYFSETFVSSSRLMQAIVSHPKTVIADVRGMATAAGCQLVASCDLALAAESAKFATPGVNIGLFCSTPMVALSRKIGRNHAMEMLLTGEPVDAREAAKIGLINRAVPDTAMDSEIERLAGVIASKSPLTLTTGKQAFYCQAEMPLAEAYEYAGRVMVENMLRRDSKEGMAAFLEKRPPDWNSGNIA
jgi:enoyl-CoA hydratase/carnithine racemase